MPHVSKRKLKQKTFWSVRDNFIGLMAFPRGAEKTQQFLSNILTPTERLMLAKRLAVIVMLCRDYSGYKIRMALKISPSTVTRLRTQLENGVFPYLELLFRGTRLTPHKKEASDFWDALYKFVLMGMPPRCGKGRWKFLFEEK